MITYIYKYIYIYICMYVCIWIRYFCLKLWFHIYDYDRFDYEVILISSQWGLFIGTLIPSQWGLFIGILIPKPMWVIHWYSDTQTNGGCSLVFWYPANGGYSLVFWYPSQWGLFIGTLIPSQWGLFIGILMPSHGDKRDHSHKIVKNMNYIWIFEPFWVLKTTYMILEMFEYLNYFESLKLLMCFWNLL